MLRPRRRSVRGFLLTACLGTIAARFGVLRLTDPFGLRHQAPEVSARDIAALYRVEPMATFCAMVRGIPQSVREMAEAPPFPGDVPLIVLTADSTSGLLPPGFAVEANEPVGTRPDPFPVTAAA